ncbi:zeta toxin family protein [Mucilaginibacter mali]|uniref:Zeta toxin family protein n=1 Tax=Mucilaginibacter mali TaxID=2740462 RepID=A0A7D4QGS7_9SPHI|nr:zeta toxin family protein [Mucilaginibacter mali]QKJ31352.1 zeta toxin family protein [Mucilaginibacter mali]
MPTLYLISGSNGAGKSTVGPDYLPKHIIDSYTVFDGDKLYMAKVKELWPEHQKSIKEAKKIAAEFVFETLETQLSDALGHNDNYVYEGHFPSYATWDFPRRFKDKGYNIEMLFLGLADIDLSEMRVAIRTKNGGHNVPKWDIENNFYGNLEMLNEHFQILDHLQIVDTSFFVPKPLAAFKDGQLSSSLPLPHLPNWFINKLPRLTALIKANNRTDI